VCAVVAIIERTQRPNHEVSDPLVVVTIRCANNDTDIGQ